MNNIITVRIAYPTILHLLDAAWLLLSVDPLFFAGWYPFRHIIVPAVTKYLLRIRTTCQDISPPLSTLPLEGRENGDGKCLLLGPGAGGLASQNQIQKE
ncbi:hypothetical protein IF1G_02584 [Cordyceps javanica]|uniref:Uncharacterized protein n=1 Tax=Cordyceps javanica TaxID=43265 RepID=A0A545V9V3_9HYPO|nr:hypothetical protein IF1G_02584 [Cordyceps javanica]